jgi:hypothetical protein
MHHHIFSLNDRATSSTGLYPRCPKYAKALVVAGRETGLEVNADKIKYMVMSRDQNAGRRRSIKTDNSSFGRAKEFKYLEATLHQNSIRTKLRAD